MLSGWGGLYMSNDDKAEWKCARTSVPPEKTRFIARGNRFELTLIMRGGKVYHARTGLPMIFKIEEWRLK
jgi:hypothetical protein